MTARRPINIDLSDDSDSEGEENDAVEEAGFFDLEAHEDDDRSYDSDAASGSSVTSDGTGAQFHLFGKLPAELRNHIWSFFCPDLARRPRLLIFFLESCEGRAGWSPDASMALVYTTNLTRCLMATHHESRALALRRFPDSLKFKSHDEDAYVRFNKETDIVYLSIHSITNRQMFSPDSMTVLPGFTDQVANLAVELGELDRHELIVPHSTSYFLHRHFLSAFTELKTFYTSVDYQDVSTAKALWAVSPDHTERFMVPFEQGEYGMSIDYIYRWHKADVPCEFEGPCNALSDGPMSVSGSERLIWHIQVLLEIAGLPSRADCLRRVKHLPMMFFSHRSYEAELKYRHDVVAAGGELSDSDDGWGLPTGDELAYADGEFTDGDESETDGGYGLPTDDQLGYADEEATDWDEYESEGIDDGSIHDDELETDDDGVYEPGLSAPVVDLTSDGDPDNHYQGFSPLRGSGGSDDASDDSSHAGGDSEGGAPATLPFRRPAKRPLVIDDSDEDEETIGDANNADGAVEDDVPAAPAASRPRRMASRRRVVDDSDDSDGD
ncbi:hypothetical protein SODALDRAFT_375805 [Sodiomyces alkalinus F11]|uniref:2EXR domain-containing protein n=1 Tax=Sodiomyces alkalinus (strain CBS 110278 / VKM F-3762 / F11) TaxID=1314773 RepID=A0A3N2QA86_SODAK|nr:hypothetical protein SODALDRAFT_375805 [Sodiomyces alkalinus F11]ROT43660.1 hypothetical protein SODALDRAFT_375805 [Sodiomyces alkalinus F11]